MIRLPFVLCLGAAVLAGCAAVGPDYRVPEDSAFARGQQHSVAWEGVDAAAVVTPSPALDGPWWALYEDATLDALVEQALRANTQLRVAAAHLEQAQARYAQARSAGGLNATIDGSAARTRPSAQSQGLSEPLPPFNFAEGGLTLSYQVDLFGRLRRGAEAARANAEAAQAASDLAHISVAAAVVGAYAEICHSNHEIRVARQSIDVQQRSRDVAERLMAAGRGTSTAVARAEAQLALLQASVPPLETQRQAAGYELAELLGLPPDQVPAQALQCAQVPVLAQAIPVGDGAALLRRRPDVRQAERTLAAATADIGVATAALYPDIRLGASFGVSGMLEDFGKPMTQLWSIGPLVSWSIPDRGAHARVAAAEAGADAALAEFDQVVLGALKETQTVLTGYAQDLQRASALRASRDHARAAAADEQRLYQAGRHPYLATLDANRTLASAEASLASAEAQLTQDQIRLFLALGEGWHQKEVVAAVVDAADH